MNNNVKEQFKQYQREYAAISKAEADLVSQLTELGTEGREATDTSELEGKQQLAFNRKTELEEQLIEIYLAELPPVQAEFVAKSMKIPHFKKHTMRAIMSMDCNSF